MKTVFRSSSADDPLVLNCTPPTKFCVGDWWLTLAALALLLVPCIPVRNRAQQPHRLSSLRKRRFTLSQVRRSSAQPSAQPAQTMSIIMVSKKNAFSRRTSTPAVRRPALVATTPVSVKYKHAVVVTAIVKLLRTCRNKHGYLNSHHPWWSNQMCFL